MNICDHCHRKATYSTGILDGEGNYQKGAACDQHAGYAVLLQEQQASLIAFKQRMDAFTRKSLFPVMLFNPDRP